MRHVGAFDFEALHSKRGLEVAQLQFYIPASCVKVGEVFACMLLRIEKGGDDDEFGFVSRAVLIVEADEAQLHGFGQGLPLLAVQTGAVGALWTFPGDDALVGGDLPAFAPVQRLVARVVKAHEDVGSLFPAAGDEFVGAEGAVGEQEVAF